jgi:hypothetical protein
LSAFKRIVKLVTSICATNQQINLLNAMAK